MNNIDLIIDKLLKFRDERDWKQFHNSKDLALAINIEAGELLELFLWKESENFDKEKLNEELADILAYCLLLAEKNKIDIFKILEDKIEKNALKYPVSKSKGTSKKYDEL
ncbi:nucleotide pyrophosphohydrolase [Litoribacter alkaliphilus]|uniref:Nucleotide pyrophosphohydrolase n=1 Tax=Litoribacter ruber TaxID=702568 RepID=A0AAP2CLK4_9BACT|nr:nucleotide pyrophosphohydrolase [Litoribacter alkaliphilus]MBS9525974.1 nucleotide pyrophosphohydrolase [Litoribacter alkaliphilus]